MSAGIGKVVTSRLSKHLGRVLKHKLPIHQKRLPIYRHRSTLANVADHVPVDGGLVGAAGVGVAGAEGHVDGAPDFLVKQDLLGELGDAEVGAEGEFAETASAQVAIEHRQQVVLILGGGCVDDQPILKAKADV